MIIATNKSDTMLRRSFEKGKTLVISAEKMFEQFSIDPTLQQPERWCYIITNEDISAARLKKKFEESAAAKHPNTKIILINKSAKPLYPNGLAGVDAILQKPKPDDVKQAVSMIIEKTDMSGVAMSVQPMGVDIPTFDPGEIPPSPVMGFQEEMLDEAPEPEPEQVELPPVPEPVYQAPPIPEPQIGSSELVDRIQSAGKVSDVSVLMREVTASNLIKDLVNSNSTYAGIEEKLKSLNDTIFAIISDTRTKSLDEKLSKVHAVLHDKAFFSAKGNTLIEQRLEEVIDMVCTRTSELLKSRLDEIDGAIKRQQATKDMGTNHARLSGLNEERANIIIELRTLEEEINDIFKACDRVVVDTATYIAEGSDNITGNDMINMHLKSRGTTVVSEDTITAIRAAFEMTAGKVPETFKKLKVSIIAMLQVMSKLFDLDAEIIAAQQMQINYLKAHNIEDSVVAQSLLKKALRVYVGESGTGRTIVPYLLSKYKSRQNANVLCIDLTGEGKFHQYGVMVTGLDSFASTQVQREFTVVSGRVENTIESAQRVVSMLLRAADYYRVINVILTTEQRELFSTISQDVLSVNFIVDTNVDRISRMRDVITQCTVENVGRRVIINKCDIPIRAIITKLGLDDSMDYQVVTVPTVPVLSDACVNGFDPYGISAVDLIMEDVLKHA